MPQTATDGGIRFGESTTRREDDRLVTGRGEYVDDVHMAGALFAVFVRSPYPSATFPFIDPATAAAQPGVIAVLTSQDVEADGIDECPRPFRLQSVDGTFALETRRPLLADGVVRFVGEPVAMIVADTLQTALDAAELVMVDYEMQPTVVDVASASAEGAPRVWPDRANNQAYHWREGDVDQLGKSLVASHHVTRLKMRITRVSAMPMEPRGALAYLDEAGRPVLRAGHQSPHMLRNAMAPVFGLDRGGMRVLAGDVGGSFGMKSGLLREEMAVLWAARRLKRAVRWTATRSEAFLSDDQGRDIEVDAELGLDATGRFTALRVRYDLNIGAYMTWRSTVAILNFGGIAGVYTTPVIVGEAVGWFSHTQVTAPYRGAGRPEATYVIERLIDAAAAECGLDPAELRKRNLIPPEAMPYQTPFVYKYDCGEFERNMVKALALAKYDSFALRREEALRRGRLRGIGIANPIEVAGGPYKMLPTDWSVVQAHPDGTVTLFTGAMSVGQGLETTLATVVAQRLGIPLGNVKYVQGDTDAIADGKGNGGSAALIVGGTAAGFGVEDLLERAREIAAAKLEAAPADVDFAQGRFRVKGTDLAITLADVARAAEAAAEGATLAGSGKFTPSHATFPNGCHICEVEIDPQTGRVSVVGYVSVEDVGRVLNPMLVEGQIHGGIAQGIGQALFEEIRYDADGQLVTGSFMDYAMPRADDMPPIVADNPETPTALNPLGVKGVGEAGTVGALAATMNAICNALAPAGIRHFDMPATPMRVWKALHDAGYQAR